MVTDSFISDEEQSAAVVNPVSLRRDGTNWFIVQTYSGHEANVKQHIEQAIETLDLGDRIFEVFIPTVEEIQIRGGQRKTVTFKKFPGYVFVQMVVQYLREDPVKYSFEVINPEGTLEDLTESALREVVGTRMRVFLFKYLTNMYMMRDLPDAVGDSSSDL